MVPEVSYDDVRAFQTASAREAGVVDPEISATAPDTVVSVSKML